MKTAVLAGVVLAVATLLAAGAAAAEKTPAPDPRFETVPAPLAALKSTHPRLYLTKGRLEELREKIKTPPYAALFREVRDVADRAVKSGPPPYIERDKSSGDEQLWQRPVGNAMPHLALVYLLTGDTRYLDAARDWMLASAGYKTWGLGGIDGRDLAAGHQLYGMALGYDWLYADLDADSRATIRRCLETRGKFMYELLRDGKVWWHRAYLQNHQWVNLTGLAAAGLALYGETDGVDGWVLIPLEKFKTTMASLGSDGASHEGLPYWSYGLEYMLKFMDLARSLLGADLFKDNAWFKNTASSRLYAMLPRNSWSRRSNLMTFADGPRYDWYGPDYLLWKLAAEYRDGHAQWLANRLDEAALTSAEARFLDLLWFDPTVEPKPPDDLPTFKHFDDMGLVHMRSGWDGNEAVLEFKCGPYIGKHALAKFDYDPGGGHVHPDAGAVQLFAFGDWLLVDDGYNLKMTAYQNTALVDGVGQTGEGRAWFQGGVLCKEKRGPTILRAEAYADHDSVIGDVGPAYEKKAGLKQFLRHVLYLKPACWVIADEFETEAPATFELYFHADFPFGSAGKNAYTVAGKRGALRLTCLLPADAAGEAMKQPLKNVHGDEAGTIEALKLSGSGKAQKALFVTVLEAYPASGQPAAAASISEGADGGILTVRTPQRVWKCIVDVHRGDPASPLLRIAKD